MSHTTARKVYILNNIINQHGVDSEQFNAFRMKHPASFEKIYGRTVKQAAYKKAQREEAKNKQKLETKE